jgi:NitT/TauT family transport system permease protein
MLSGFSIAVVLGLAIGSLIAEFKTIERIVYPLIVALQSLPKIALAPLILIWVGFGLQSKITMAALVAFFPMLVNTVTGLRAYDRDMNELFRSLSASRWQRLWYLRLPAAVPFIVAGLDVSFIFALLGAIVGEFVGASAGLGYAIIQLQYQLDTAGVFAILVLLALIGVAGHTLIGLFGKYAAFWQASRLDSN